MADNWYEICSYNNTLRTVPVERSTATRIMVRGRWRAQRARFYTYYPSLQSARDAQLRAATERILRAEESLMRARQMLADLEKAIENDKD